MFFFIAGIQPKTVVLDDHPRMCPSCGLYQARLKRVDHYLSIFFLPVLRVKKGQPFLYCEQCAAMAHESGEKWAEPRDVTEQKCPYCGGPLESSFRFCPSCGKRL